MEERGCIGTKEYSEISGICCHCPFKCKCKKIIEGHKNGKL